MTPDERRRLAVVETELRAVHHEVDRLQKIGLTVQSAQTEARVDRANIMSKLNHLEAMHEAHVIEGRTRAKANSNKKDYTVLKTIVAVVMSLVAVGSLLFALGQAVS